MRSCCGTEILVMFYYIISHDYKFERFSPSPILMTATQKSTLLSLTLPVTVTNVSNGIRATLAFSGRGISSLTLSVSVKSSRV